MEGGTGEATRVRAGRRRLTAAERSPQILEAALAEFAERGYGGASMAGAAARAGIAKALIYHYFTGKAELFKAVVRACIESAFGEAETLAAAHAGSHEALLRRLIEMGYRRVASEPRDGLVIKLLLAETERFPELAAVYRAEVLDRGLAFVTAVVRAGVEAGEFRAGAEREAGLAAVLLAPVVMASVWRAMLGPDGSPDLAAMGEAQAELVLRGLRRGGTDGPGEG